MKAVPRGKGRAGGLTARVALAAALTACLGAADAGAQGFDLETIVLSADIMPGTTEPFLRLGVPGIDADGEVFFVSRRLDGSIATGTGLWRATRQNTVEPLFDLNAIVKVGDAAADIGVFRNVPSVGRAIFNSANQVAFPALIESVLGTTMWTVRPGASPEIVADFRSASNQNVTDGQGNTFFGRFGGAIEGLRLNDLGQMLFASQFGAFGSIRDGLFVAISKDTIRAVAFGDTTAVGLPGLTWDNFVTVALTPNGDVYFRAKLNGAGVTADNDRGFWKESGGIVSKLMREGDNAPGLAGRVVTNIISIAANENGMFVIRARAADPSDADPDNRIDALWKGTGPDDIQLVFAVAVNDSAVTGTTVADLRSLESFVITPNGDLFFTARNDTFRGEFWKLSGSTVTPVALGTDPAPGTGETFGGIGSSFSVNTNGGFSFFAGPGNTLYATDQTGAFRRVVGVGDVVGGRTITRISMGFGAFNQTTGGGAFNDNGDLAFTLEFGAADDAGVFRATFAGIQAITDFFWSGGCGTTEWHSLAPCAGGAPSNWNDQVGSPVDFAPGDGAGEKVTIANSDVVIQLKAVAIDSLSATGSLTVNQPLTLAQDSNIEGLKLNADLTTAGRLTLSGAAPTGDNVWTSGGILGNGSVVLAEGSKLEILPPQSGSTSKSLQTAFKNRGTLILRGGRLILDGPPLENEVTGIIDVQDATGFLLEAIDKGTIINRGTFQKTAPPGSDGSNEVVVTSLFLNANKIKVDVGTLSFTGDHDNLTGSTYEVAEGATLQFRNGITVTPTVTVSGNLTATGEGTIRLANKEFRVNAGATAKFNVGAATVTINQQTLQETITLKGGLMIDGANIVGGGVVQNDGVAKWLSGDIGDTVRGGTFIDQGHSFTIAGAGTKRLIGRLDLREDKSFDVEGKFIEHEKVATINMAGGTLTIGERVPIRGNVGPEYNLRGTISGSNGKIENFTTFRLVEQRVNRTIGVDFNNRGSVRVAKGSTLNFTGNVTQLNVSDKTLEGGAWLVEPGATLKIVPNTVVTKLTNSTLVRLQGNGTFSVLPTLFNSPNTVTFEVDASSGFSLEKFATYIPPGSIELKGSLSVISGSMLDITAGTLNATELSSTVVQGGSLLKAKELTINTELLFAIGSGSRLTIIGNIENGKSKPIFGGSFTPSRIFINGANFTAVSVLNLGTGDFRLNDSVRGVGSIGKVLGVFVNNGDLRVDPASTLTVGTFRNLGGTSDIDGNLIATTGFDFLSGTFSGSGIVTTPRFTNTAGLVKPGDSPGVLTFTGDYIQEPAGSLEIELGGTEAGTQHDQLVVGGTATIRGSEGIQVTLIDLADPATNANPFRPRTGDEFDILVAGDIQLPDVDQPLDLITFVDLPAGLSFEAALAPWPGEGTEVLRLMAIFGSQLGGLGGLSPGAANTARALDAASMDPATSDDLIDFAVDIDTLPTAAAKTEALGQASLSFATALYDTGALGARLGATHIARHLDGGIWGPGAATAGRLGRGVGAGGAAAGLAPLAPMTVGDADDLLALARNFTAGSDSGETTLFEGGGFSGFVASSGEFGDFDASTNQTGFDYAAATGTVGVEYDGDHFLLGLAGSFAAINSDVDGGRGDVDGRFFTLSGYGLARLPFGVTVDGTVSYGWNDYDYRRVVTSPAPGFTARGDTSGNTFAATLRGAAPFALGDAVVGPVARLQYIDVHVDGFTESGGGGAALTLGDDRQRSFSAMFGLRGALPVATSWGTITPRASAGLVHEFVDDTPTLLANFVGAPTVPFAIPTDDTDDTYAELTAGLAIEITDAVGLSIDYQGIVGNRDLERHTVSARLRIRF